MKWGKRYFNTFRSNRLQIDKKEKSSLQMKVTLCKEFLMFVLLTKHYYLFVGMSEFSVLGTVFNPIKVTYFNRAQIEASDNTRLSYVASPMSNL